MYICISGNQPLVETNPGYPARNICMYVCIYIYILYEMAEINVYETSLPQVKVSQAIYEVRMHIQAALSDRVSTIPKYPKSTAYNFMIF
jgi:hypothetical protein